MDEDLNMDFDSDTESNEDPKICSECEREFEGDGEKCPSCDSDEKIDLE